MRIEKYTERYREAVIHLILKVQRDEFGIPITIDEQPDLKEIETFYANEKGGFFIAVEGEKVIGTIGTWFLDGENAAIRKLFTDENYRGKEYQTGQKLLDRLEAFCSQNGKKVIYLGTTDKFKAAHRFYEKNGYDEISKKELPHDFDIMAVDSKFYRKML